MSNLLRWAPTGPRLSATLHDLTSWTVPQHHRPEQVRADREFAERVLSRADGLIAVSEHTRADAVRILGLNRNRIKVIYPGVADSYFSVSADQTAADLRSLRISRPYILFIGTIEPRKNIDTLLDGWMSLPDEFRSQTELILAGMPGWDCERTLRRLDQMQTERYGVRYLGYVENALLPGLTSGALGLVYPSYYEGFGFPVAQAMAAGCPCIVANVASLPEVASEACLLIDPGSAGDIATAILKLSDSSTLRTALSGAGRQRASLFTWRRAAEESVRYFNQLST